MSKVRIALTLAIVGGIAAVPGAGAATLQSTPRCDARGEPALLVRITGFRARSGSVRVQSYGGDPAHYFDKGSYLKRIDVAVPTSGPLDVCVPVPGPGSYAVSVRHDANGSGRADRSDGGGMSGNPSLSLFDILFKRKPDPATVAVRVERGVRIVPVTLNYIDGGRFRPVAQR